MRSAILLVLALPLVAHADPQRAETDLRGGFLLPRLQLSASTDDHGKFKADVPYLVPGGSEFQIVASAHLQIASANGVSTLFSTSSGATLPWEAGLSVLIVQPQPFEYESIRGRVQLAQIRAYDLCVHEGADPKTFKSDATPTDKVELKLAKLCPDGHAQYLKEEATLAGLRSIPENRYSFGAAVGQQRFSYLTGPFGAGDTLATGSSTENTLRAGALITHAWSLASAHAGVIEIHALYARAYDAASRTGHWCAPEGMVGSDPNSAVQLCKDLALGPPTRSTSFTLGADIGVVDSFSQSWRASVGMFDTTGIDHVPDAFGFEVPIYLNFAAGSSFGDQLGSYKGILRITPKLVWAKDASGHFPTVVVLTVEALAQNSVFSEALDY